MRCAWLALWCVGGAAAFFEKGSDVVVFDTPTKWREHNPSNSSFLWIVNFYREGCGFCVLLEPEMNKAASKLRKLVRFGAVDVETHRRLSDALVKKHGFRIEGVPTVMVFSPTAPTSPFPYAGERKAKALIAFAGANQPDFIERVSDDGWAAPDGGRGLLLFTEKRAPTGLFKALASRFRNEIAFGAVYCGGGANAALLDRYGVTDLPALVVLPSAALDADAKAARALAKLEASGAGFRIPLPPKPSFMKLEFALMPFAAKRKPAPPEAAEKRKPGKRRRPPPADSDPGGAWSEDEL